jgi:indolepyruvate ferredoxin oxidoreductase beta subunit
MNQPGGVNLILAGCGGQGIVLAAEVCARAALAAGFDVKAHGVRGMAQRGGCVMAHVRYGLLVQSPLVEPGSAHVLVAFECIEALRCASYLASDGLAVVSTETVVPVTVSSGQAAYPDDAEARLRRTFRRLLRVDAGALAAAAGNPRCSNLALLGAVAPELGLPADAWRSAIGDSVRPALFEANLRAFEAGQRHCECTLYR